MPPSQLKRLKSSLRDQGITGPQKSKKQKKAHHATKANHADRHAALQQIRDSFNPFELRPGSARPAKFESVSHASANKAAGGGRYKAVLHRPGVSKSAGEEMRRRHLLPEMQRRNKVGGLVDRRIGEGDPGMTAEERAVQRFAREKEGRRGGGGGNVFDLEGDDEGAGGGLTHLGRKLSEFGEDDFAEAVGAGSEASDEDGDGDGLLQRKRRRSSSVSDGEEAVDGPEDVDEPPERKKSKKEVMQEVIAKSKLHKYERQKVKEDDEDLIDELDKGMADMLSLLQGHKPAPPPKAAEKAAEAAKDDAAAGPPQMNPDRQRLLDGMDRGKADKEYEVRLRQLAQDTRAQPSERTKTEEEKAAKEAERLKELEGKRAKRMRGEEVSDDEEGDRRKAGTAAGKGDSDGAATIRDDAFEEEEEVDEAAEFGFTSAAAAAAQVLKPGESELEKTMHEDEDEFAVDDDLVASSESEAEPDNDDESSDAGEDSDAEAEGADPTGARDEEEDDEFVKGIMGADPSSSTSANRTALGASKASATTGGTGLSYTYPCPRTHADLLAVVQDLAGVEQLPTVIQRIRALHHTSLSATNKESMADFAAALVEHLAWMGDHQQSLAVIEQVIRHLHSLSRTYPVQIAEAFRRRLKIFHERAAGAGVLGGGDLVILTAIGSIYPTSDHFHQVVTPAITLMARWLGLNASASSLTPGWSARGALLVALCVRYQALSKRVVPEAVRFTLRALGAGKAGVALSEAELRPHIENLMAMADLWEGTSAFAELFAPAVGLLERHAGAAGAAAKKKARQHLTILLNQAHLRRRPLELHHHRLQPIRTSIPKFEEGFNPDKHYDPDKERSEARKLQQEFKREKKGAVRELRKDANFMAREGLREKRERDGEYERKQRRLIAEIQEEAGREGRGGGGGGGERRVARGGGRGGGRGRGRGK
ncbi:hypothetical protein LTR36_003164 [Oleoguttula mirabilis]|uniref:Nucleolar protein 14 n=1 Tax=Oleoguttula mirabilis TaxID=1507867 RepID=A0AAV9JXB1_9PEZI|nr:hypothetical protein LTR36_003164 [Oleoguttula mirabilis]